MNEREGEGGREKEGGREEQGREKRRRISYQVQIHIQRRSLVGIITK